jgi:hypothetical protein
MTGSRNIVGHRDADMDGGHAIGFSIATAIPFSQPHNERSGSLGSPFSESQPRL